MDTLRSSLAGLTAWIESHALGVGVAGLVSILVGGGLGVASLMGDGETATSTTVTTAPPLGVVGSTSVPDGAGSVTTQTQDDSGAGPTLIAVKIDNDPSARPQIGLQEASLIIEVPVEGGLTRFTAFYEPGLYPAVVGPVRSVRPVDAALAATLSTVMVSTGGQPFVLGAVEASGMASATPETAPGFQALERPAPNNLFVDLTQIQSVYPPEPALDRAIPTGELPAGADAGVVVFPYQGGATWEFIDGAYARSEDGVAFEVASDPFGEITQQLTTDTVVVLFAAERSAGYTDGAGAAVPTFDVVGSGRLLVFNGGKVVEGTWLRAAQADRYRFLTASGEEFGIPEGRTHMAVVPRELEVEF